MTLPLQFKEQMEKGWGGEQTVMTHRPGPCALAALAAMAAMATGGDPATVNKETSKEV